MTYTYSELKHKTVAELREIAKTLEHEAVQGYTQMNKEHLLVALCKALNIDMHEHRVAAIPEKTTLKMKIRALKRQRDAAIQAHDHEALRRIRKQIKRLKNRLRQAVMR
ncbi:MAG: Rho termination factor N-terminal domain-containing protein [candidate division KSB1 bacterium]|nr:Rho termination factor N-terminal domain-containing protein [candidate division KSB1 bacterium]MDZ7294987.1 Rho termination factor N-terminal domain-containing protein [candidate division KSB1 bacterium]MDZ7338706.1 Rho termination factor N-terminal domain-containing protein [candidate division KSB1 bacterium]MDZ7379539.1 Rho termination factor N-terminal domain-containing protein [candidate division KSB1 bacterium]MDZ7385671.1 Rho termination factor N-terminal domain-containing protein [can